MDAPRMPPGVPHDDRFDFPSPRYPVSDNDLAPLLNPDLLKLGLPAVPNRLDPKRQDRVGLLRVPPRKSAFSPAEVLNLIHNSQQDQKEDNRKGNFFK